MGWFSEPKPDELDEDWIAIEPWDDHSWRRLLLVLLALAVWVGVSWLLLRKQGSEPFPPVEYKQWISPSATGKV